MSFPEPTNTLLKKKKNIWVKNNYYSERIEKRKQFNRWKLRRWPPGDF